MKKWMVRIGISLLVCLVVIILVLGIYGVPAPPSVTTKNLPRIPWNWAFRLVKTVQQSSDSYSYLGWDVATRSMWIREGLKQEIGFLSGPGSDIKPVKGLPKNVNYAIFPHDPDYPFITFYSDKEGGELYDLYAYDHKNKSNQLLVADAGRVYLGPFSPDRRWYSYASTRHDGSSFSVSLIDPADPSTDHLVYDGEGDFIPATFSASGRYLIMINWLSFGDTRLFLHDIESGQTQLLAPQIGDSTYIDNPRFAGSEAFLYVISDFGDEYQRLMRLDLPTGELSPIKGQPDWDVVQFEISDDKNDLVFMVNMNGINSLYHLALKDESIRPLPAPPNGFISYFEFLPLSRKIALSVSSVSGRSGVLMYDLGNDTWTSWIQPEATREEQLPDVEAVNYPTFDSIGGAPRMIPAFLFPGNSSAGRQPVLIDIHGGPTGQSRPYSANPMYPLLREQGITIIAPNVRGSSGYGKTYHSLDDRFNREDAVRDIGALLEWIGKRDDLEEEKVGVMGGSYGGYMTLASLVHYSSRFKCGCDLFGISDLNAYLDESSEHHFPEIQRQEFGDNQDPLVREFLDSISPINQAERITVPLLIFQGSNDVRVKPDQSRRIVETLEALDYRVYYVEAGNEGHGIRHPLNLLFIGAVGMHIMEKCLKGEEK
jgi:dipeptidyl aminopeptidase/acylaminoacyl peptidase